jgi:hypothetical protein
MRRTVETYKLPNSDFRDLPERVGNETNLLRGLAKLVVKTWPFR